MTGAPRLPSLGADEMAATADWLCRVQLPSGMVPWSPGGHADPWNHTEAAMAMVAAGRVAEAEAAYRWLERTQLPDGSWCLYYLADGVEEPRRDPNVCAYVAAGLWWHHLVTGDDALLEALWPVVDAAIGFVVRLQQPAGGFSWSLDVDGRVGSFALLTGTSSIHHSLAAAVAIAGHLREHRPGWEQARMRAAAALNDRPGRFAGKDRWAMDWYYPVLSGALSAADARERLERGWSTFAYGDLGVRCMADEPWITAAETAECAMAFDAVGDDEAAAALLAATRHLRHVDGSYWTGCVHPQCVRYPGGERTTYGAAAVLMAHHIVADESEASGFFRLARPAAGSGPAAAPAATPTRAGRAMASRIR